MEQLNDIERLQHLRSCLAGDVLESVRSFEISGVNYRVALGILNKRFNNKGLVFQAHIKEILKLKRVGSASAVTLRDFSDKIIGHMRALQALGNLKQISGCTVVYRIVQKLDAATQANWEESLSMDKIPNEKDLLSKLEGRCQKLKSVQHALASYMAHDHAAPRPARRTLLGAQVSQSSCVFCDTPGHRIYSCGSFPGLSPSLRQKEVKRLSLCFNCLKKGHHTRTCNSGHCRTCGGHYDSPLQVPVHQINSSCFPAPLLPSASESLPSLTRFWISTTPYYISLRPGVAVTEISVSSICNWPW